MKKFKLDRSCIDLTNISNIAVHYCLLEHYIFDLENIVFSDILYYLEPRVVDGTYDLNHFLDVEVLESDEDYYKDTFKYCYYYESLFKQESRSNLIRWNTINYISESCCDLEYNKHGWRFTLIGTSSLEETILHVKKGDREMYVIFNPFISYRDNMADVLIHLMYSQKTRIREKIGEIFIRTYCNE